MKRKTFSTTDEGTLLNILIACLLIGIIITSIGIFIFRFSINNNNKSYSEIFFKNPDNLPNVIKINQNYSYKYSIRSHENETRNLTFKSKVETYNIYDYHEIKYNCMSNYRKKEYIKWTNETSNKTFFNNKFKNSNFENLIVTPDYSQKVNWPKYSMEFKFSPPFGKGLLAIAFTNETNIKYKIIINEQKKNIAFNNKTINKNVDLRSKMNELLLHVNNENLIVYLNDILIINTNSTNLLNGTFSFETQGTYYSIQNYILYKNKRYNVPQDESIKEYDINIDIPANKRNNLLRKKIKKSTLQISNIPYNFSIDCQNEPFYCKYYNLANDISFYLDSNITESIQKIPAKNINYVLKTFNSNDSRINWTSYHINITHSEIAPNGSLIIEFNNKWGIMLTKNNSYYIRPEYGQTVIDEIRNPFSNKTKENIQIIVNEKNIILQIGNKTVFTKNTPWEYTDDFFRIYLKNSITSIENFNIYNDDPICTQESFKFCEINLKRTTPRRPSRNDEIYELKTRTYTSSEMALALFAYPFIKDRINISLDDILQTKNITINKTEIKYQEQLIPETQINIPIINPHIPDTNIAFDSPNTEIKNQSHFSMDYRYKTLDGARVPILGFADYYTKQIATMYALEDENKFIFYFFNGSKVELHNISYYINTTLTNTLGMEIFNNTIDFSLNRKSIFQISNTSLSNGYFFIGAINTYIHIANIHLFRNNFTRTLSIDNKPCEFKLINQTIETETMELAPGEQANFTKVLNVPHDFDYGKVSVELEQINKSKPPLEIHFWVMRDDS